LRTVGPRPPVAGPAVRLAAQGRAGSPAGHMTVFRNAAPGCRPVWCLDRNTLSACRGFCDEGAGRDEGAAVGPGYPARTSDQQPVQTGTSRQLCRKSGTDDQAPEPVVIGPHRHPGLTSHRVISPAPGSRAPSRSGWESRWGFLIGRARRWIILGLLCMSGHAGAVGPQQSARACVRRSRVGWSGCASASSWPAGDPGLAGARVRPITRSGEVAAAAHGVG
jgi:hypothetical protein